MWTSSGLANLADGVVLSALPLLAATVTRDPALIAGITIALRVPWLIFALLSGAIVDRLDRRKVMVWVGAARTVILFALALAVLAEMVSIVVLYAIAVVIGVGETLYDSASGAILPLLVGDRALGLANGRIFATQTVLQGLSGPPVGAFLFSFAAALPFGAGGAAFLAASVAVFAIPGPLHLSREDGHLWHDIRDSIVWLRNQGVLRKLAVYVALLGFLSTMAMSILVLFVLESLGASEVTFGLILAGASLGGVAGSVSAQYLEERLGTKPTLVVSVVVGGATLATVGLMENAFLAGVVLAINSASVLLWNVVTVSMRQALTPNEMLGRMTSIFRALAWGSMPIGAGVGGALASMTNLRVPFFAGGIALMMLSLLVGLQLQTKDIRSYGYGVT